MSLDADQFKRALRSWASGVTVVTSKADGAIHGMTVSAFSSVSAEPPLVLVCANRSSTTHGIIEKGEVFTVNILASDQQDVSNRFASSKAGPERFEGIPWHEGETGAPVLDEALASLECEVKSAHVEGSHTIFIGEVKSAAFREEAEALLYFDGGYRLVASK